MLNRTFKAARIAALSAAFAALIPVAAHAQYYPPMDMSWAIRSQMNAWNVGQANAANAANAYLRYMQALRARGYTGPSLPTGVTNESLRASINGANRATQNYIRGSAANSTRTGNAIGDYSMRAIRGCERVVNQYGQIGYVCP